LDRAVKHREAWHKLVRCWSAVAIYKLMPPRSRRIWHFTVRIWRRPPDQTSASCRHRPLEAHIAIAHWQSRRTDGAPPWSI